MRTAARSSTIDHTRQEPGLFGAVRMRETRRIDGAALDRERDTERLLTQMEAVREVLRGGKRAMGNGQWGSEPRAPRERGPDAPPRSGWLTVEEIEAEVFRRFRIRCPQASASAQVRNLRKRENGGHEIEMRYREGTRVAEYRMVR